MTNRIITHGVHSHGNHSHRVCIAPMMGWTDRHDRYFLRLITRRALLYTEMVTVGALLHGDAERHLAFDPAERPVALQLGGGEPGALAECAGMAEAWGYDAVNLNCGCPSNRVRNGRFGACLMAEPALVADCVAAMREATALPVTVKSRIGIDDQEEHSALRTFVDAIAETGCDTFIVHARKAWLKGLSPRENREVPPLRYESVRRLKRERPDLTIVVNGGVTDLDAAADHLRDLDGAMIGRAAYRDPYMLADVDRRFFGEDSPPPDRRLVARRMIPYAERRMHEGAPLAAVTRHMMGLFNGLRGARTWRRRLSEDARAPGAGPEAIERALECAAPATSSDRSFAENRSK